MLDIYLNITNQRFTNDVIRAKTYIPFELVGASVNPEL